jgi:hypothetical protein
MSSSSDIGNSCGHDHDRGGRGRGGLDDGGWEDSLPHDPGLHFHHEIILQMGDQTRVGNVVI